MGEYYTRSGLVFRTLASYEGEQARIPILTLMLQRLARTASFLSLVIRIPDLNLLLLVGGAHELAWCRTLLWLV